MCYQITLAKKGIELAKRYEAKRAALDVPLPIFHAHGFAHPQWPVLSTEDPDSWQTLGWGLIPNWAQSKEKAMAIRGHTLNARNDTIMQKPSYRQLPKRNRCIVPVTGFFEFYTIRKQKWPMYFYPKGGEIISLAGIWDAWVDEETGEVLRTFSIITTDAPQHLEVDGKQETMERCPLVLLDPEQERAWIDPEAKWEPIHEIIQQRNTLEFAHHLVSRVLNKPSATVYEADILEEVLLPELKKEEKQGGLF